MLLYLISHDEDNDEYKDKLSEIYRNRSINLEEIKEGSKRLNEYRTTNLGGNFKKTRKYKKM
jgi:hypothetical protein